MPTHKSRLTKPENQENRTLLSRLAELKIPIGPGGNASPEFDWLVLEQTEDEWATIYELPLREVAVVLPAKMIVARSGKLITAAAMMTPWEDQPLELNDLEGRPYYRDLIGGLYRYPPILLNDWLTGEVPLRTGKVEGVILAYGYIPVPPKCHDETLLTVKLLLVDERRNELSFEFGVRVDRSVIRKCERRQRERRKFAQSVRGRGLFEPKGGQLRDQKSASREEAIKQPHVRGKHDGTGDARTPEPN